jgi:hypoxanthine phosphoribosyltransferase
VLACITRQRVAEAHRGAHARNLVRGDGRTQPRTVDHDGGISLSPCDLKRRRRCGIGIVDRIVRHRSQIVRGNPARAQVLDDRSLQRERRVVAGHRDRADVRRRRETVDFGIGSFALDRDPPRGQRVLGEWRDVAAGDEKDGGAVLETPGVGLGDHLKAFHGVARTERYVSLSPTRAQGMQTLISTDRIQERVRELAREIREDHPDGVHLVCVLKGAFVFLSDLARSLEGDATLDFMALSSYGSSTKSSGQVQLLKDLDSGLEGRDVVIVEDIVDTGLTLTYLQEILRARSPRSLRTVCLLSKPSRRQVDVKVEYIGFSIEDRFVVGYGLDFAEKYRNLPYIAVIDD